MLAAPALATTRVYWANETGGAQDQGAISFADLDGSAGGDLATTGALVDHPQDIAIDPSAGTIYWANTEGGVDDEGVVSSAGLDGSGGSDLTTERIWGLGGLAIDALGGRLYWTADGDSIVHAALDATGPAELPIGSAPHLYPEGLAVDPAAGKIYWANYSDTTDSEGAIAWAMIDGSGGGEINTDGATVEHPEGVAVDLATGRIYWGNDEGISYANLDGTGGGDVDTAGAVYPTKLAIDPVQRRLYWSDGESEIASIGLDAADPDVQTVDTGAATVDDPSGIVLLAAPAQLAPPSIAATSADAPLTCTAGAWAPDVPASLYYRAPERIAYQWRRDGTPIPGATQSTVAAAAAGSYTCTAIATNAAGSTASAASAAVVRQGSPSPPPPPPPPPSDHTPGGSDASGDGTPRSDADTGRTRKPTPQTRKRARGHARKRGRPNTRITNVRVRSRKHRAAFRFRAIGRHKGLQCKLRRGHRKARWHRCRARKTYRHLRPGRYILSVRAIGPAGRDRSPAQRRFRIRP